MKFEETFDFDFDADTILRMFSDRDYYADKYAKLAGPPPEIVDSEKTASRFSIVVRHALDAGKLSFPDIIKKRMGERIMLRQTDTWQLPDGAGRIDIDIEKAPVDIVIDMRLANRADGNARLSLSYAIDAGIPLLGGKIEKALAGPIAKRVRQDLEISNRLAADYRG